VVGSLVHEALAAWRFPTEQSTQRGGFEPWARARARGYGLTDPRQLADAVRQSEALLTRFHVHPLCFEMVAADQRLHEVPYSLQMEGRLENGIIDALYRRQGVWTIVEFKTDAVRDRADLSRLLADQDYVAQSRRYVAASERLLGQRVQAVLCLLNYAGQVHVYRIDGAS
jgi:ATP-dependent exoDNAse (exonuclease V) beta subunit